MASGDDTITKADLGAFIEHIDDKFDSVVDGYSSLADKLEDMNRRLAKVEENTEVTPVLRSISKDHSTELADHAIRLTRLEHKSA